MYIALQCPNCGEEHPLRQFSRKEVFALLALALTGQIHAVANNHFSDEEWTMILLAEITIRNRRS